MPLKKLAAVYFALDCTPGSSGFPNLPRVTKTWPQKHSARAENEQLENRCGQRCWKRGTCSGDGQSLWDYCAERLSDIYVNNIHRARVNIG